MKKKLIFYFLLFLLSGYSSQESEEPIKKPRINFYGTLIDSQGKEFKVENITISGMYKQIPFYAKPKSENINPDINITRIDLSEVKDIKLKNPKLLTFNKRHYTEVSILLNDKKKTSHDYIIESTKRIFCDEKNEAGAIEKEIKFQGIKKLTINGYKSREEEVEKLGDKKKEERELIQTNTTKIIKELEESSKKIATEKKEGLENLKDKILSLLKDLKDTLKPLFN